ncbi:epidermal growth factor receptor kinase substrate 8 1 isoform X1 [Brachionus plicatilis]|uniref:Epidermal growth factor receptor kinase substrate 8 1 isoform X1 n=1 Tax=Brachionus plicatilis TaxID=10195 RepID=A0A3M7R415_BRAPC|nr:epidermal growth factor receptor kinase substrate 8 1 isoform X1 [Brachionus plicatilis]
MSFKQSNLETNYVQRGRFFGPVYDVDHLATFEMGAKNGLLTAEDGMRKLRILEKSQGIWTMSCQILIDTKYMVLYDKKTREELDLFPVDLVSEPTSVISDDKTDPFNNILLFTVLEDIHKQKSPSDLNPTEMHFFQCKSATSTEIVDEIYKAIDADLASQHSKHELTDTKRTIDDNNNTTVHKPKPNVDQDLKLLNSCFDDIEQFVTRLQISSEQYKELDKKHKSRKSKNKHSGDGLLQRRAQLPQESEFTDTFQKIKLSFNLLARLKPHIHDPNAPELVHFLFTPVALIANVASQEPYSEVSRKVWQPLLTKEAKELLLNCLSSKEQDLWISLGECWTVTREDLKLHPNAYPLNQINQVFKPVFSDGSAPDIDLVDAKVEMSKVAMESAAHASHNRYRQTSAQAERPKVEEMSSFRKSNLSRINLDRVALNSARPAMHSAPPMETNMRQKSGPRFSDSEEMRKWAVSLVMKGGKVYEVKVDREAKNEKELDVKAGDLVEVLDDKRNWWRLRNFFGSVGHAPITILRPFEIPDRDLY